MMPNIEVSHHGMFSISRRLLPIPILDTAIRMLVGGCDCWTSPKHRGHCFHCAHEEEGASLTIGDYIKGHHSALQGILLDRRLGGLADPVAAC